MLHLRTYKWLHTSSGSRPLLGRAEQLAAVVVLLGALLLLARHQLVEAALFDLASLRLAIRVVRIKCLALNRTRLAAALRRSRPAANTRIYEQSCVLCSTGRARTGICLGRLWRRHRHWKCLRHLLRHRRPPCRRSRSHSARPCLHTARACVIHQPHKGNTASCNTCTHQPRWSAWERSFPQVGRNPTCHNLRFACKMYHDWPIPTTCSDYWTICLYKNKVNKELLRSE